MSALIISLILHYSQIYHVDPIIALSVASVESGLNPNAVGPTKDLGVFQLNPKTFNSYSKKQLLDPETNIKLGVRYIAEMKRDCTHNIDNTYVLCYNLGTSGAKKVKHPKLFPYYKNVMKVYNEKMYLLSESNLN